MKISCIPLLAFPLIILAFLSCNPRNEKPVDTEKSSFYYYTSSGKDIVYKYYEHAFGIPLGWRRHKLGADPNTFVILSSYYAKDKNNLYYKAERLEVDINSYILIKDKYVKDKNAVFCGADKIMNVDALTFEYDEERSCLHDKNHVFINTLNKETKELGIITEADPQTYTLIKKYWAKDKDNYFFSNTKIDVDVPTFQFIAEEVAYDKNKIYYFRGGTVNRICEYQGEIKHIAKNIYHDNRQIFNFQYMPSSVIPCNDIRTLVVSDTSGYNVIFSVDNITYRNAREIKKD